MGILGSKIEEKSREDWFKTDHLRQDLKGKSIRGGLVTASAQAVQFILRMGSTMFLARMLSPSDFGLIAMVAALANFAIMFRELGLSMATIQQKNISHRQVSNLFWINTAIGVFVAAVLVSVAPAIAYFYGEPKLTVITQTLAISFLFSGLGVQHKALLRRQMRLTALGLVTTCGIAAGVTAAIVAAFYGAGYWSLVILTVTTEAVTTLATWIACPWLPGLPRRQSGTRPLLGYGGNVTGFGIVNYFARNLDNILIGRYWGSQSLGFYSKAYYLMMLPVNQIRVPIQSVAMPALSQMQDDPIRYKRYYLTLVGLLAFITMPLMAFLFVNAEEMIYLVLGPGWEVSVDIFRVLCIAALIQPVATTNGLVLLSLGQSRRFLKFGVVNSTFIVASVVTGIPYGAKGVAIAYVIANYIILTPSLWYCFRRSPIDLGDFFSCIARPFFISILMAVGLWMVHPAFAGNGNLIVISLQFLSGVFLYFGLWLLVPGGFFYLKEMATYRTLLIKHS